MAETIAACRAEFTKICRLRSTLVALLLFVAVSVIVGVVDGASSRSAIDSHSPLLRPDFTPEQAGLDGILYGQLALIVFGVLIVAGEYTSGMMRVSLLAVPRRSRLYTAKMTATGVVTAVIAVPVTLVTYLATQTALGPHGASVSASGVPLALAGGVVYLTLICLFAAGLAAIARNTVAPLVVLLPMVLAGSHLLTLLGVTRQVAKYLPDQAGSQILSVHSHDALTGLVVLLAWTAAALIVGYVRHRRWDS